MRAIACFWVRKRLGKVQLNAHWLNFFTEWQQHEFFEASGPIQNEQKYEQAKGLQKVYIFELVINVILNKNFIWALHHTFLNLSCLRILSYDTLLNTNENIVWCGDRRCVRAVSWLYFFLPLFPFLLFFKGIKALWLCRIFF